MVQAQTCQRLRGRGAPSNPSLDCQLTTQPWAVSAAGTPPIHISPSRTVARIKYNKEIHMNTDETKPTISNNTQTYRYTNKFVLACRMPVVVPQCHRRKAPLLHPHPVQWVISRIFFSIGSTRARPPQAYFWIPRGPRARGPKEKKVKVLALAE